MVRWTASVWQLCRALRISGTGLERKTPDWTSLPDLASEIPLVTWAHGSSSNTDLVGIIQDTRVRFRIRLQCCYSMSLYDWNI